MNRSSLSLLVLAASLALSACQSIPTAPQNVDAEVPEQSASLPPTPVPEAEPIVYGSFTTEQLNRAILNELGGQRGHIEQSAQDYFDLAMETGDLAIIQRASQFATAAGDSEAIIALSRLWIEKQPNSSEPHMLISFQLLDSGRIQEAITHIDQVMKLGGTVDFTTITTNTQYMPVGQRNDMITGFRTLLQNHPEHRSLHYGLIQLLEQTRQPEAAMQEVDSFRKIHGDSARVTLIEAQLLLQMEQIDESLAILKAGVNTYPENRLMRFNYGRLLVQVEEIVAAREQFAVLAEMDPSDFETLYSLALIDLELEEITNAKRIFSDLLTVDFRVNEAHFYLGYIDENEGNTTEAIEHYQQVLSESGNFVNAQRQIVRLLISEQRFDEAHAWVNNVSREQPNLELMLITTEADSLLMAGQPARAGSLLTEAIARYPENTDLLFARSLVSEQAGDMGQAEADLRRIIELQPQDARALNQLGYTLTSKTDRHQEALTLLEQAIAVSPDDPAIIDSLAWAQYNLGRYEEALGNLERAYAVFRDHEVAAHLGEVLWVMGRRGEATRIWEDALRERPDSALIKEAMDRLRNGSDS